MLTLKQQCAIVLDDTPATRSDDNYLVMQVWSRFYDHLIELCYGEPHIPLGNLHYLPSYDNVLRYRRMLAPLYPPTEEVARHRNRLQKERRREFGENTLTDVL